jgi:DNA-binding transcriptional LysR family regulator
MRDELGALMAFTAVARTGSFRAAGEELGVTGSALSQAVKQLEDRLGLQLLRRTTRSVSLTEAGTYLNERIRPAFADVRAALAALDELKSRPSGLLRLTVSSIAEHFLGDTTLSGFLESYPDIALDVFVDDDDADIVAQGFDAGVRLGEVIDSDMVAVSVSAPQRQIVVCAPQYRDAHGAPQHPRDLHRHACIGWRRFSHPAPYRWEFTENDHEFEVAIDARLNTNDMRLMVHLACRGVGLTIGLEETFRPFLERGELVPVLERFCPAFPGFFLYYPSRTQAPAKVRALVSYMRAKRDGNSQVPPSEKPQAGRRTRRSV